MKLGILRFGGVWDADDFIADVDSAARAGFSSYWIPNLGVAADSLIALAIVGREVPGIELGAGIVPTWTRHPLVMAQSALTVTALVGDRFSLGLGLVHKSSAAHNWGLPFERPITHIREYLEILQPVLDGEPVDYAGKLLTARASALLPGAPRPSLYLAAMGTQMLTVAGQLTDGTIVWMTGPRTLSEHTVPTIRAAAEAAGRPGPRVLSGTPVLVTDDVARGRALAAKTFARYASLPTYTAMMAREGVSGPEGIAVIGDETVVRDTFRAYGEAGADAILCAEFADNAAEQRRTRDCLTDLLGG